MFYFLLSVILVLSTTTAILLHKAVRASNPAPADNPPTPTRPPENLPTKADRWMMEQEHELFPDKPHKHVGCRVCGPGPLLKYQVPSRYDHVYIGDVNFTDDYGWTHVRQGRVTGPGCASVVSSEIEGHKKWHTLMLDIDLPSRLVGSSTPGHHHLYIDKPMLWRDYKRVIKALTKAGIIEEGFYKCAKKNKATHLRPPWAEKE